MVKTLTAEQKKAMADGAEATREAIRQTRAKKLVIGKYSLYKHDEFNYAVDREATKKDDVTIESELCRFYPTYSSAITALFHILVGEKSKDAQSLRDVMSAIASAELAIRGLNPVLDI